LLEISATQSFRARSGKERDDDTLAGPECTSRVRDTVAEAVTAETEGAFGMRQDPVVGTRDGGGSRGERGLSTGWRPRDCEEGYQAKEAR
jgi:hypothetical protein